MIILLILITSSHDDVWISLGENCSWSLLGLKGLIIAVGRNGALDMCIVFENYNNGHLLDVAPLHFEDTL